MKKLEFQIEDGRPDTPAERPNLCAGAVCYTDQGRRFRGSCQLMATGTTALCDHCRKVEVSQAEKEKNRTDSHRTPGIRYARGNV